ncbi:MAG: hypothetical protein K0U40_10450 [Betaproteobacteria bacterium]|nr:hypothetical protein [Betaproteobacteria bacterium]
MHLLIEKFIRLIPAYFNTLLPLLTGPKHYIFKHLSNNETEIHKAQAFLAISFLISWTLKIPLARGDPFHELGSDAIFVLIFVMAYGSALYLAWSIVGGRAEIKKFWTIHFYYSGVLKLLMTCTYLATMGTIRAADPVIYKEIYDASYDGQIATYLINNIERLFSNLGYQLSLWVQFIGYGSMLIWIIIGWGAYRELNQLSRVRSTMAGFLFFVFCIPVATLTFFIANALVK